MDLLQQKLFLLSKTISSLFLRSLQLHFEICNYFLQILFLRCSLASLRSLVLQCSGFLHLCYLLRGFTGRRQQLQFLKFLSCICGNLDTCPLPCCLAIAFLIYKYFLFGLFSTWCHPIRRLSREVTVYWVFLRKTMLCMCRLHVAPLVSNLRFIMASAGLFVAVMLTPHPVSQPAPLLAHAAFLFAVKP